MRALVFDEDLQFVKDYPAPVRKRGESLIRVSYAGICNTDLEISKGYMAYRGVLGHEFVGIVEETDTPGLAGKRVVGEINIACGECDFCRAHIKTHCPNRTVLGISGRDGAMADYVVLPDENLHEAPPGVSDEAAVFVEPLAAAFEILSQINIRPGRRVLVLGDGKLGLLVAQVINTTGADCRLIGRSPGKLALARRLAIATADLQSLHPQAADIVIDCTGSPEGLPLALRLVKPRGTVVVKTTVAAQYQIDLAPVVIHEIMVMGSRCGPFRPALSALASGTVRVKELITGVFPLEDALAAFKRALEPGALKILLRT
ncbi:MAG: alcohol dehydrogenase [Candidatus Abyssobacteria bacterium SURF_5]|uniref:Alcohol dehydrogenase n=1 Tax=Abyssobacteria bacterium (strain SURF_5) TaxID=2093360 RepID=A0A3A4MWT0_ABYX5|nr:MAG: alcohol dehydrogenase [Candidatus Abyssubacteria bacterium SURF_5]